jgi:hypothetical protein
MTLGAEPFDERRLNNEIKSEEANRSDEVEHRGFCIGLVHILILASSRLV